LAVHARLAGEDVLDRVVEHVPEREHARDVRRRDDNGIRGLRRFRIRDEKFSVEPELIPLVLDRLRFVSFWNLAHFFNKANSMLSTSACKLASMMFSLTPTRPHSRLPSVDSMRTRVRAAVPATPSRMRTL